MEKLGFGIKIQDFIKKTNIYYEYQNLIKNQLLTQDELVTLQFNKFKLLITHAYNNVPYYRRVFNELNLRPEHIKSFKDIYKIPILTKELARKYQSELVATNFKDYSIKRGKTGGTTGIPLEILKDQHDRSITWASYYRWYTWMGIRQNDRSVTLWGARTVLSSNIVSNLYKKISDRLLNNVTFNSFNMSPDNIGAYYDLILDNDPKLIKGYLSSIILLASYMQKNNLSPNRSLLAISCTTETLTSSVREFIEGVFKVPLYDQYGCGEVSSIAFECKNGGKHITQEHVFIEVLDSNNTPIIGSSGKIVVTGLDNFVMPFIRYQNGDISSLLKESCSCGLPHKLLGDIEGRSTDTVTLNNGNKVHGVFFTDIFYELGFTTNFIKRFQIIQLQNFSIKLILEVDTSLDPSSIELIHNTINKFVTVNSIKQTKFIENIDSGKFRYIISQ